MNDDQIKEVMRLADEIADYAWKEGLSDGAYSNAKQDRECRAESRAELEAYLRTIGEPDSVNAELLEALKGAKGALEKVIEDCGGCEHEAGVCVCAELSAICRANAAIARAESAIETPAKVSPEQAAPASTLKPHVFRELVNDLRDLAKQFHGHDSLRDRISGRLGQDVAVVSPCAGHAAQQEADEVISLAQALEQHRARKIVDAVSALPVGGKHEHLPSPFQAGYQLACEEVMHRLLTEEWDGCMTPPGQRESDDLVGLRGCNSRHGGRATDLCKFQARMSDPGCAGCEYRGKESQPMARRVEKLEADRDALAAELKALEPKCPSYMPNWTNHGAAIADPVFHQIRGIMGTQNWGQEDALRKAVLHALRTFESSPKPGAFRIGDLVKKVSGSAWEGRIVGTYSTALTPEGFAVESASHPGSVQIYPAKALTLVIQEAGD